jgi:GT2 family glycosyltransferase
MQVGPASQHLPVEAGLERVAVVILTYNQRDMTLRCLDSLQKEEDLPFDILLWDNGSADGTAEAVAAAFPGVMLHESVENLGVAGGRNAAARLAFEKLDPNYLLFLDNDMVVEPGFVKALLVPLRADDHVGQTQAKLRFVNDPERLNDGGGCDISFILGRTRPVGFGEVDRGQYDQRRPCVACGGAMMVRTELFRRLGGFDTIFNPFGPEDLDFSLRLAGAGYQALFVPDAVAYHEVSHTFGAEYDAIYARLKIRHWLLFMKRHAPRWKVAVFFTLTAPWLFVRTVSREAMRGNFSVLPGLVKGIFDFRRG